MLIVPLTGKLNLKNLPVVTISLIVVNCAIFFLSNDAEQKTYLAAMDYYVESGLYETEVTAYRDYLGSYEGERIVCRNAVDPDSQAFLSCYHLMHDDDRFQKELTANRIITPGMDGYTQWRLDRDLFEADRDKMISRRWGLIPDKPRVLPFVTYMFLHGSLSHLVGNMIFLWLVGCALELGIGRLAYGVGYGITGVCSALLYVLVYSSSNSQLVGASGAIAGLMGAFSLLFAGRRIRVFYSLGFYFNTVRAHAWLLFPVWVASEVGQLVFGEVDHVAYMAHIGGLLSGGLCGLFFTRVLKQQVQDVFDVPPEEDRVTLLMDEALACMDRLDVAGAKQALETVLSLEPGHPKALDQLYTLARNTPNAPSYHRDTVTVLTAMLRHGGQPDSVLATYDDYVKRAPSVKLPPSLYLALAGFFPDHGREAEADRFLMMLTRKVPTLAGLPEALLRHATYFKRVGNDAGCRRILAVLRSHFPDSPEAALVQRTMGDLAT
ncbi:rhomboid family intramembrane serine protease [Desulfoluna spongiiphila]|uniref:Membrane associated serine protease, rhomboid family n=1 Tax=Desulfoluna spongiiphila TaxID=419481 RepID=A0A1G5B2V8_9BACT|nr:rhomboid family intramembrane serine protease [Desulfoluna spongiiphila]SCX84507.1 Membrane associated serine protease, rhomboid family [Desulfoluna spongiiphila]